MRGEPERPRRRVARTVASLVLLAAIVAAIMLPRDETGRRFVEGGGNITRYNTHVLLRLFVLVGGLVLAGVIRWWGSRPRLHTRASRSIAGPRR